MTVRCFACMQNHQLIYSRGSLAPQCQSTTQHAFSALSTLPYGFLCLFHFPLRLNERFTAFGFLIKRLCENVSCARRVILINSIIPPQQQCRRHRQRWRTTMAIAENTLMIF